MEPLHQQISNSIIKTFPVDKVKTDLFDYLNEYPSNFPFPNDWFPREGEYYLIQPYNIATEQCEQVRISAQDPINIIQYDFRLLNNDYFDCSFAIDIAIGKFTPHPEQDFFFTVDKCLARLRYNGDLTLCDVEFSITEQNKP